MLLTSADALCRYLLNSAILGAYEITEKYLIVAMIFLGLSFAYRGGVFIRVTFLIDRLPRGWKSRGRSSLSRTLDFLLRDFFGGDRPAGCAGVVRRNHHERAAGADRPAYCMVPLDPGAHVMHAERSAARAQRPERCYAHTERDRKLVNDLRQAPALGSGADAAVRDADRGSASGFGNARYLSSDRRFRQECSASLVWCLQHGGGLRAHHHPDVHSDGVLLRVERAGARSLWRRCRLALAHQRWSRDRDCLRLWHLRGHVGCKHRRGVGHVEDRDA